MSVVEIKDKSQIAGLFEGWDETMIWSCLQNCMGKAYGNRKEAPGSARIIIADFCFFAGKPDMELVKTRPKDRKPGFLIMVPQNEQWAETIERVWGLSARRVKRYAMKKEKDVFDLDYLEKLAAGVTDRVGLCLIDEEIYHKAMSMPWSMDLCSQFQGYEDYAKRGLGVAALAKGELVCGASSYTVYQEGIEIEIDTRSDWRRRGLAKACGAKLILECSKRGLYPSWDAQNPISAALAEKLGYHLEKEYAAYEIKAF